LAENTPSETFIDNVDRESFENWQEYEALYPTGKPLREMPWPRKIVSAGTRSNSRSLGDARGYNIWWQCRHRRLELLRN
jgi:hypothetical protein